MPNDKYLRLEIAGRSINVKQVREVPISISYALEDPENFEQKKSATAFDITVPATLENDKAFNTFHNPKVEDLTTGETFKNPTPCIIEAEGTEVLKGVALLKTASRTCTPQEYKINIYGNNGDWMIPLQETTLYDCLNPVTHIFNKAAIEASWLYDGNSETFDYVYAPVRYKEQFAATDTVVNAVHLRPAISPYWMIYRAFKSIGYRISSLFMDDKYFRKLALAWTWGDFLKIKSGTDFLKFKALLHITPLAPLPKWTQASNGPYVRVISTADGFDVNDETPPSGFDNSNLYAWNGGTGTGTWTYPNNSIGFGQFGQLVVVFEVRLKFQYDITYGTSLNMYIEWYVNGASVATHQVLSDYCPNLKQKVGVNATITDSYQSPPLNGNDTVSFQVKVDGNIGSTPMNSYVYIQFDSTSPSDESYFRNIAFKKPVGGIVNFKQYEKFKEYKLLDMFRGMVDAFNWSVQTDPINKIIYIEPTYPYAQNNGNAPDTDGYYKTTKLDWTGKQDLSKLNELSLYAEAEKEFVFGFKPDSNDGGLNKYYGRFAVVAGESKYVFPERFKTGKRELTNRFFSSAVHIEALQWKEITGVAPQLMAIVPENISNTSANEAEQFFQPKLAWYKGKVNNAVYGGWKWQCDPATDGIDASLNFPFMFAVNYKPGGESDPILTYNDQDINGTVGKGLVRKFFLQRLAIMRYGKFYAPWIHLNNKDVTNWLHREAIYLNGDDYYLVEIEAYKPLLEESTLCRMWKFHPVTMEDTISCFPSTGSVLTGTMLNSYDTKYAKQILLNTDLI